MVGQGPNASEVEDVVRNFSAVDGRFRYIYSTEIGLSRARNAAIRAARGSLIALIDDDCEADSNWLAAIRDCFESDPTIGLVGGALIAPPPPRRLPRACPAVHPSEALYDPAAGEVPAGWDWCGANVSLRIDLFEQVGLFDEMLGAGTSFPASEDVDYKLRLEAHGVRMMTTPAAVVRHMHGWRSGIRQVAAHQANYSRGCGALAAKLTLQGDSRGHEWLKATERLAFRSPFPLPRAVRRYLIYRSAYFECLQLFRVAEGRLVSN